MDENEQNKVQESSSTTNDSEVKEGKIVGADGYSQSEKESGKALAILSYIGLLALIPYLLEKENKWVKFHAVQGMNLMIWELILIVIGIIPILGAIISFIGSIFSLILAIIGIVNVCNNEAKELPIISSIKFIKE